MNNTLTAIDGIQVGHATDLEGATGCTVIICPENTIASVDVRGGAPGTRETDLLAAYNNVQTVNAIVLSGGSAYGLATADGVMKYLAEQNIGYKTRTGYNVPIVPAAILFDLMLGKQGVYPDATMGYQACVTATNQPVQQGCVGAGTGAVCGAIFGKEMATKSGIGSYAIELDDGLIVAALVAVNAVGDVLDEYNQIMAGVRQPPEGKHFIGMMNVLKNFKPPTEDTTSAMDERQNTLIGVVASNAKLNKAQTQKIAQMAQDGIARAIQPAHTPFDGDTIFALSTGQVEAEPVVVGAFAAEAITQSIRAAIHSATSLDGVLAYTDIQSLTNT